MHDLTSTATEAVTLFAADASADGTMTAERRRVEHLASRLGLDREQLSAVHAVMTWAVFLRPSTDPDDRERLRSYLDVMGFLPADRKIVASAERSRDTIEAALPELLQGFAEGEVHPETFLETDTEQLVPQWFGSAPTML